MKIEIKLDIEPPTCTAQMRRVKIASGKPIFYLPDDVKAARDLFLLHLKRYKPSPPLKGALSLTVNWIFKSNRQHPPGTWRTTRPDTDNLQKLLKDCMTKARYWYDDAQVCVEIISKSWGVRPGIEIIASELETFDNISEFAKGVYWKNKEAE